jgi:hypothetical protein
MGALAGHIAAAQALVVALVFAWAGLWKVAFRRAKVVAAQSALVRLLRNERHAVIAHLALGCAELTVAILLLLPPLRDWALRLAALLTLGFLGYLLLAWRIAPESNCACMGGRATRISWRSVARAGALLVLSVAGWPVREFWGAALVAAPWLVSLLALELAGVWLLSPEFGGQGARAGRQLGRSLRLRLDPACARVRLDIGAIERALQGSAPYRALQPALGLGVRTDAWREGCWYFVAYGANHEQQPVTVIFAAPALFDASEVSAAVVADADNSVLLSVPSQSGALPPAS